MKILVQSDSRIWGGNEKWLVLVGVGLAERNHAVLISCQRGGPVADKARAAGLRITHRRPGGDADIIRAAGFAALIRKERPDAVLLSALKRVFWGGWAAHWGRAPRVVERLGIEQNLPKSWKYGYAFRHYIDALIVNSHAIRDRWLRSAPWFPAREVHVVFNSVFPSSAKQTTIRSELGLSAATPIVATAGRLETRKGFDLLLAAFARIAVMDARLVIAGNGADERALRGQAEMLGVSARVHWLGFRHDLENVLLAADVFVLPSRREGMANVMLEAMAAGCLVVATDVSGVREAIGAWNGRMAAGWIVPVDDAAALGAALREALTVARTSPAETRRTEAEYRIENWFCPTRNIEHTERVLAGTAEAPGL